MVLRERTETRLVGSDQLGASLQVEAFRTIGTDLRRALSVNVPDGMVRPDAQPTGSGYEESGT